MVFKKNFFKPFTVEKYKQNSPKENTFFPQLLQFYSAMCKFTENGLKGDYSKYSL